MRKIFIFFMTLFSVSSSFAADTIILKPGQKVSVPNKDGAKLYQEAFVKVKEPPAKGDLQIPTILLGIAKNGWQDDARIVSLLNDNREAMDLFKKATQQVSDGYILGKLADGSNGDRFLSTDLMKKYFSYLPLFNLILIEANQFLAKGDYQAAQDDFFSAVRFIKHLTEQKEGGALGSVFVLIAEKKIESLFVQSFERNGLERFYFQNLLQSLQTFPSDEELAQNWLQGEDANSLIAIKYHMNHAIKMGMVEPEFVSEYISTYEKESRKFLDYALNAIKIKNSGLDSPIPERVPDDIQGNRESDCKMDFNEDYTYTDKAVACWMKYIQEIGIENEIRWQLKTKMAIPHWRKYAEGYYSSIAIRNNFMIATATKLYKLDKGHLPEKLDDLLPEYLAKVPEDAFDNFKPIKYVRKSNGYLIYSLGPDRADQKGDVICDFVGGPQACDIALFVQQ